MAIGTKYHSNSAYPPKFLVQFEAKYLPQIAPEAVSEHEYVKNFWGVMPPDPPRGVRIFVYFWICHCATPQTKMSRSALASARVHRFSQCTNFHVGALAVQE